MDSMAKRKSIGDFRRDPSPFAALEEGRLSPPLRPQCFPNQRVVSTQFLRRVSVERPE